MSISNSNGGQKKLGRVFQSKVDEIKALAAKDFTRKEIAEKLNVSQGTVRKYLGEKAVDGCEREVSVLFEGFFDLLTDLEMSTLVGPEHLDSLACERGLEVARRLFKLNKPFAQKILSPYLKHLRDMQILNLAINDHELSEEDLQLRNQWLGLLKTEFPEKLAEFL
jgi:predicted transcriptional regulator